MSRRRIAAVGVVGFLATAVVGLSAAAPMSTRGDSRETRPAATKQPSASTSSSGGGFVTNPGSTLQTPDVVARYWTEERMRDARPMERGVTTGAMAPASPRESGRAPATTPSRIVPARRQSKTKASQATGPADFTRNPDVGNSTYDGWTQEEMDAAQPLERTVTGGEEGSGAPSDPPGGSVGGGIP